MFKKLLGGGSAPAKEKEVAIGAPQNFEKKTQETVESFPEDLRKLLLASGINDDQRQKFPTQTIRALQLHAAITGGTSDAPARPTRSAKAQAARREAMMKARSDKALVAAQTTPGRQPLSPRSASMPVSPRSAAGAAQNDGDLPLEELVNSVLTEAEAAARYAGLSAAPGPRSELATMKDETVRLRRVPIAPHAASRANIRSDLLVVQAMGAHPNIAEYRTSHLVRGASGESLWLASEPIDGEPLVEILEDQGGSLGMGVIAAILRAALAALDHLHARDLVLQDLRAGGFYITAEGGVKLLDVLPRPPGCFAYWLAPEAVVTNQLAAKGDVWSVGILASELLEGKAPHSDMQPAQAYLLIATEGRPPLKTALATPEQKLLKDFIDRCTVKDPESRPALKDLQAHPFLALATPAAEKEMARLVRQLRGARSNSGSKPAAAIQIDEWPPALLQAVAGDLGVVSMAKSVKEAVPNASAEKLERAVEHIDQACAAETEKQLAALEAQRQAMLTEMCRREVEACKQRYMDAIRDILRELERRGGGK